MSKEGRVLLPTHTIVVEANDGYELRAADGATFAALARSTESKGIIVWQTPSFE
jgi:hypothetical protein